MTIHYFLGLGQGSWSERWLAERLTAVTFHKAPDYLSGNSETAIVRKGLETIEHELRTESSYILIAESQAAPSVMQAIVNNLIPQPERLVLLMPLGLNYHQLGTNANSRRSELFKRSGQFWRHRNQSIRIFGNRATIMHILRESMRHPLRLKMAYTVGANQDCVEQLHAISQSIPVDLYAAKDDSLFPFDEIAANVSSGVSVHKLSGTHLNRATPKGLAQLKQIIGSL